MPERRARHLSCLAILCLLLSSSTAVVAAAISAASPDSRLQLNVLRPQDTQPCLGELCATEVSRSVPWTIAKHQERDKVTANLDPTYDDSKALDAPVDLADEAEGEHQQHGETPDDGIQVLPDQTAHDRDGQDSQAEGAYPDGQSSEPGPQGYQPAMTTLPESPSVDAVQPDPHAPSRDNIFHDAQSSPAIEVRAIGHRESRTTETEVTIVWRSDSNVQSWKVSKTTQYGNAYQLVRVQQNLKEVTTIMLEEYCSYIVVEAVDRDGKSLGNSAVIETIPPDNVRTAAVAREHLWQQDMGSDSPFPLHISAITQSMIAQARPPTVPRIAQAISSRTPTASFIYGILCTLGIGLIWRLNQNRTPISVWLRGFLSHGQADSIELSKVS